MQVMSDELSVKKIVEFLIEEVSRFMPQAESYTVEAVSPVIYATHNMCGDCAPKLIYFQDVRESHAALSLLVRYINEAERFSVRGFDPDSDHHSESFYPATKKDCKPKEELVLEDTEFYDVPYLMIKYEDKNAVTFDVGSWLLGNNKKLCIKQLSVSSIKLQIQPKPPPDTKLLSNAAAHIQSRLVQNVTYLTNITVRKQTQTHHLQDICRHIFSC